MSDKPFHIRPRFKEQLPVTADEFQKRLEEALEDAEKWEGRVRFGFVTVQIPFKDQHFWSPQLTISYESTDDGVLVRGMYGPRPNVWTMFVFFYAIVGMAMLAVLMVGLSNLTLDKDAVILWWVPVLVLVFLSLFLVARAGQSISKKQMVVLHEFVEQVMHKT